MPEQLFDMHILIQVSKSHTVNLQYNEFQKTKKKVRYIESNLL